MRCHHQVRNVLDSISRNKLATVVKAFMYTSPFLARVVKVFVYTSPFHSCPIANSWIGVAAIACTSVSMSDGITDTDDTLRS